MLALKTNWAQTARLQPFLSNSEDCCVDFYSSLNPNFLTGHEFACILHELRKWHVNMHEAWIHAVWLCPSSDTFQTLTYYIEFKCFFIFYVGCSKQYQAETQPFPCRLAQHDAFRIKWMFTSVWICLPWSQNIENIYTWIQCCFLKVFFNKAVA